MANYMRNVTKTNEHHNSLNAPDESVYVNLRIHNHSNSIINAVYDEVRSQPLLANPNDWKLAVARLDCDSFIPLFLWGDIADKFYVTLEFKSPIGIQATYTSTKLCQYIPYSSDVAANENQPVYTYYQVLQSINIAYQQALDAVMLAYNNDNGFLSYQGNALYAQIPPLVIYTPSTNLFSIVFDYRGRDLVGDVGSSQYTTLNIYQLKTYMSDNLYGLFETFDSDKENLEDLVTYKENRLKVLYTGNNFNSVTTATPPNGSAYPSGSLIMTQSLQSTSRWYDLVTLILQTTMDCRQEFYNLTPPGLNNTNSTAVIPILTDLEYSVQGTDSLLPISYKPSFYRWVDWINCEPLYHLNYSFSYLTRAGKIHPIQLSRHSSCNVKLCFSRL